MPVDSFLALLTFAFVSSISPGPNNVMLLASGVNFGFWRTVPHMFGIAAGFGSLLLCVGFGLGALLTSFPALSIVLKFLGGSYLLYLAWRIAMSRSIGETGTETGSSPMTFVAAAAFQWVNPKAWMMAITAMTVYSNPNAPYLSVFMIAAAFVVVNFPSVSTWVGFGTMLRSFLEDPVRLKWFNIAMGSLLALTIVPMLR
ncbi:LysE family translocator [Denitrobaculum tricleocarpae]|uniref:LysE family translocator n=1 Tax=Denitrobaculum tricleocarpae TaxID=2591009 RepID=A0A545TWN6_9PROT|nr:LysE family translocator [Denitrobaculum tricleocarpae]TQV81622.1 LysE family translocator [Denitrobaculum tricleocarpae]